MDISEALDAENRNLEKAAKRLVDTTAGERNRREQYLHEIAARLDMQEQIHRNHVYPILRTSTGRADLVEQYQGHINSLRDQVRELQELPRDVDHNWQNSAETLAEEVGLLTRWEQTQMVAAVRDAISDHEAQMYGQRIRAEEKTILHERL